MKKLESLKKEIFDKEISKELLKTISGGGSIGVVAAYTRTCCEDNPNAGNPGEPDVICSDYDEDPKSNNIY
jgi:hypothetical protein